MHTGTDIPKEKGKQIFLELIDFVRFPLAVFVVAIHWNALLQNEGYLPDWGVYEGGVLPGLRLMFRLMISCAVPVFFMISGYLFFRTGRERGEGSTFRLYTQKLKRRVWTLLVPFLAWNIMVLFLRATYKPIPAGCNPALYAQNLWGLICGQHWHIFWDAMDFGTYSYPILVPLWYIRDLMVVVILSPLFYVLLRPIGHPALSTLRNALLVVLLLYIRAWLGWPFANGASFDAVLFYGLGAAIALQGKESTVQRLPWAGPIILMAGVIVRFYLFGMPETRFVCVGMYAARLAVVYGFLMSAHWVMGHWSWRFPAVFTRATMFIYCWHAVCLIGAESILNRLMRKAGLFCACNVESPIMLFYLAVPPIVEALAGVCIYQLLRKHLPRACTVLTGGK